jgi:hypothetical protein
MDNTIIKTYTGTGVAQNIEIGFEPSIIRISSLAGKVAEYVKGRESAGQFLSLDEYVDTILTDPAPLMGTTKDRMGHQTFQYRNAGIPYTEAALLAGSVITATVVPVNKWGLFGVEIGGHDGNLHLLDAAGNAVGYASEALAIAALPTSTAGHTLFMYVTVMCTAGAFTGDTTEFDAAGVTAHFYANCDAQVKANGITLLGGDDAIHGFTVGTAAAINTLGADYTVEAIR